MPYKSEAQRRYLHANHPEIAKQWDAEYPAQAKLPEHSRSSATAKKAHPGLMSKSKLFKQK